MSQNARILDALGDREWHTTEQIHAVAGFSRLNSRIAELRDRGYVFASERVPGEVGPRGHKYRLLASPDNLGAVPVTAHSAPITRPVAASQPIPVDGSGGHGPEHKSAPAGAGAPSVHAEPRLRSRVSGAEQLTLIGAGA